MAKKIAVLLCGSGYKDGSEIRESVGVLWALSEQGAEVQCYAPDENQLDVVNSLTGDPMPDEKRNMLIESARIARAEVKPLTQLEVADYDGLIIPGGFGAAKNLCDFAFKGAGAKVRADVEKVVREFHEGAKKIGAVCIAPAILALVFRDRALTLTVGAEGEAAHEIEKLGHIHQVCPAHECVIDGTNRIVTSPAYMYDDAKLSDVFKGIAALTAEVLK